jgi:TCP-1/cpn60 chaperonin family
VFPCMRASSSLVAPAQFRVSSLGRLELFTMFSNPKHHRSKSPQGAVGTCVAKNGKESLGSSSSSMLVDVSVSQDIAVGDGTTSVLLLAAEIVTKLKPLLVEDGMSPTHMIQTIREAGRLAMEKVDC